MEPEEAAEEADFALDDEMEKSMNNVIIYGNSEIWEGPCENLDRDGSNGMGFVLKTWKIRPVMEETDGKVDFPKYTLNFGHGRVPPLIESHSRRQVSFRSFGIWSQSLSICHIVSKHDESFRQLEKTRFTNKKADFSLWTAYVLLNPIWPA